MAKRTQPKLPETKFKRRATVSRTETGATQTNIDIVPDDPTAPTREGNVRDFLDQALKRFQMCVDAEMYFRTEGLKDALMVDGEGQWDDDIRGKRIRKKRPVLTLNRFIPMIAHVANEQRMSRPAIQIDPVGGGADPESAEIRQGLIRHIEVTSNAETVYDTAFERMIEKGWSWFRVVTDWESPLSHHQVIRVEGFTNDFCVYGDPNAEDPTRKDQKFAFVVYDMPRGDYLTMHPRSKAASMTQFASIGDQAPGWLTTDSVRVAEYYYIEDVPMNSVRLIGGDGIWEDEIEERSGMWFKKADLAAYDAGTMPAQAVQEVPLDLQDGKPVMRKSSRPKVKWCKINAVEILDGNEGDDFAKNTAGREIAGKFIPLIMVCGRERMVRGQRRLAGMVRNNRDAQRIYNYMASGFVEMVALAPKSPFIAAIGQIEDFKPIWDSLNEENWPFLPYKPRDVSGQLVPPPQRQEYRIAESVSGYLQGLREFDNIIKIGFNIFDPSLGTARADQSGRAVAALQGQSDSANFNWLDNMRRAIIFCGEVMLEMLPIIYDAPRVVTINRVNKPAEEVQINQEFVGKDGKVKNHDLSVGKYSVTVSLGQYASKRAEAVRSLTDVAKNVPQVAIALLPLILENMDSPMATEAAAIVKRMQPPQMQEPGSPEQVQSQFAALQAQHQQLMQALQRATEIIQTKQLDHASKERIAGFQAQAQLVMALAKSGGAAALQFATQEFQRIQQALDQDHERQMAQQEAAHEIHLELVSQTAPAPAGGQ